MSALHLRPDVQGLASHLDEDDYEEFTIYQHGKSYGFATNTIIGYGVVFKKNGQLQSKEFKDEKSRNQFVYKTLDPELVKYASEDFLKKFDIR